MLDIMHRFAPKRNRQVCVYKKLSDCGGIFDEVMGILNAHGKRVVEFPGIMPNPTYAKAQEGARPEKENDVDLILAVGGGSVSDCCKVISELGKKYGKTPTQIILRWHIQDGNFDIYDFELTADEMAQIAAMNQNKRYYNVSNGMAVTEDTPKAIADLTLKLLNEPELLSKMRAAMPQVSCTAPEAVYSWIRDHKE